MNDRSGRPLERALLFSFVIHGVAMGSMALLLLPGMPGGGVDDTQARMRYMADHPWLWRLGWLPWQLTALSDVMIGLGLLRAAWIPRMPAVATMIATIAAVVPDQSGQICWMTRGLELARAGDPVAYLAYESRIFEWTAVWGGTLYTIGALGWTWCFSAAGTWSRPLSALSMVLWPLFFYVNAGPLLPRAWAPSGSLVAAGNGAGFVLLQVWFILAAEQVMRRSRPVASQGRQAPWRHPGGLQGRIAELLANSWFLRGLAEVLPVPALESDITDVIYVNYLVEAGRLAPLAPEGLELRKTPGGRWSVFTFLTFRHGHFGPRAAGPLRRLLPSPIQTNWRIHVRDPRTGKEGIYFVTNAITGTLHALAARLMSEGMPMHVPASAELRADGGTVTLRLDSGRGSAPDVQAELRRLPCPPESGPWSAAFGSWTEMLAFIVPQDRALSTQPWRGLVTRQEIHLDIPLEACEPLEGMVDSRAASAIVGDAQPFCFRVAAVRFRFEGEKHDPLGG